jgi:hypothetical protein
MQVIDLLLERMDSGLQFGHFPAKGQDHGLGLRWQPVP